MGFVFGPGKVDVGGLGRAVKSLVCGLCDRFFVSCLLLLFLLFLLLLGLLLLLGVAVAPAAIVAYFVALLKDLPFGCCVLITAHLGAGNDRASHVSRAPVLPWLVGLWVRLFWVVERNTWDGNWHVMAYLIRCRGLRFPTVCLSFAHLTPART